MVGRVIFAPARPLSLALAALLAMAAGAGCASAAPRPASQPSSDPATPAQIDARLLAPGTAPGFRPVPDPSSGTRSARAQPFVPPGGAPDQACTSLAAPLLFRPTGILDAGRDIEEANGRNSGLLLPPSWFEYIDVYPGTEAAGVMTALPAVIGRCGHFRFQYGPGAPLPAAPATEVAAPLAGLGSQALYVTVRIEVRAGAFQVADWVVIRSDRTLIWISDQSGSSRSGTGDDPQTLRLAQDAWRRYRAP